MPNYHLAQVNLGRFNAPMDDPNVADFFEYLAPINALADVAPGFVWRFQTYEGDATSLRVYDDDRILINFSVWESVDALKNYVYKGSHSDVLRMKRKWFEKMSDQYIALWWVPAGHVPTWYEAKKRLDYLRKYGDTAHAFSFRKIFTPQGEPL